MVVGTRVALVEDTAPEFILPAFEAGLKMLVGRGLLIRLVTWGTMLVILGFVTPADLGVLVATQAFFGLTGLVAEWGYTSYLIRRRERPGTGELRAFGSAQLAVALVVATAILAAPESLFAAWMGRPDGKALLVVVAIGQVFTYGQNGSKAVLEREMSFAVLARIDVATALLQSVILMTAALLGQFFGGIPVALVSAQLVGTAMFAIHVPQAWRLTLDFRPLRDGLREATGFTAKAFFDTLNGSLLPLAISSLFGLAILGSWSMATRLGQVTVVVFEGFWRAGFPAASRLAHEREMLDRLTRSSFRRALRLSTPIALLVVIGAPLIVLLFPLWAPAILAAQIWSVTFAVAGSVSAALAPRQVALTGPRILSIEAFSIFAATLGLLALLRSWPSTLAVAVAFCGGAIAGLVVLLTSARSPVLRALMSDAVAEVCALVSTGLAVILGSLWGDGRPAIIISAAALALLAIARRSSISRPPLPRRGATNSADHP